MPKYILSPIDPSHLDWLDLKGHIDDVLVHAESSRQSRVIASETFKKMQERNPDIAVPWMPWLDDSLVKVRPLTIRGRLAKNSMDGDEYNEGTVKIRREPKSREWQHLNDISDMHWIDLVHTDYVEDLPEPATGRIGMHSSGRFGFGSTPPPPQLLQPVEKPEPSEMSVPPTPASDPVVVGGDRVVTTARPVNAREVVRRIKANPTEYVVHVNGVLALLDDVLNGRLQSNNSNQHPLWGAAEDTAGLDKSLTSIRDELRELRSVITLPQIDVQAATDTSRNLRDQLQSFMDRVVDRAGDTVGLAIGGGLCGAFLILVYQLGILMGVDVATLDQFIELGRRLSL